MGKQITLEDIDITGINMWPPHSPEPLRVEVNYSVKTDDPELVLSRSSDFTADLPVGFTGLTLTKALAALKVIALAKEGITS